MKQELIDELISDRNWRFSELEYYKKIPKLYTNALFINHLDKYWRMCVPMVYAHWEGFVVASYKQVVGYLSRQKYKYSQVQPYIILLSNKERFGYLQGNQSKDQKLRFLKEYTFEEFNGVDISSSVVSTSSNLNYKQFVTLLDDFGISPTAVHDKNKAMINKLVTFRNKISHGENSVIVHEDDVNQMINCVMEMVDTTISDIYNYLATEPFCS